MQGIPFGSRYVLGERLGRGGMGQVYRAAVRAGGPDVAVKLLRDELADQPDVVARFVQERDLMRSIDHPNVVRVHELIVDDGRLGIVMDLMPDGDLRRADPPPVPPRRAAAIGAQIAHGLAALHAAGVVHRDLKPENVLVASVDMPPPPPGQAGNPSGGLVGGDGSGGGGVGTDGPVPAGRLRLTDFGISRLAGSSTTRLSLPIGTPTYMSPEVANGLAAKPATDVYALGVMLYEWCTGTPPFTAGNPIALLRAHAEDPVPRPGGVPGDLVALIEAMLAKDPHARPSADVVAGQLELIAAGSPLDTVLSPMIEQGTTVVAGQGTTVRRPVLAPQPPPATVSTQLRPPSAYSTAYSPGGPSAGPFATPHHATGEPPATSSRRRTMVIVAAATVAALTLGVSAAVWAGRHHDEADGPTVVADARTASPSSSAARGSARPSGSPAAGPNGASAATAGAGAGAAAAGPAGGADATTIAPPTTSRATRTSPAGAAGRTSAAVRPTTAATTLPVTKIALPGAVSMMNLSGPTQTTMRLVWGAASGATSYRLGWTESGPNGRSWTSDDQEYGASSRSVTLINLLPGRTYDVTVTPVNASGTGPVSRRSLNTKDAVAQVTVTPQAT